jgi:hypothetical protein
VSASHFGRQYDPSMLFLEVVIRFSVWVLDLLVKYLCEISSTHELKERGRRSAARNSRNGNGPHIRHRIRRGPATREPIDNHLRKFSWHSRRKLLECFSIHL